MVVVVDICLCEYIDYGYCGFVKDGVIFNDVLFEFLV